MNYGMLLFTLCSFSIITATESLPTSAQQTYGTLCSSCSDDRCNCKRTADSKCHNCLKDDPMEQTEKIVLAAIPEVLAQFIRIVQDPNNKESVIQCLSSIFANIITIATSAFKGNELEQQLRRIILSQSLIVRALTPE